MASLNTSTNGPSISKSYNFVLDAPAPTGSAGASPTYAQWALFVVSTPLVNAFQQGGAGKESVLKVQSTGEGELDDLVEEFSDGRVQFAFVKVKDPNTGLPKNVFIAWCGEGVPERTKGYFTSHLTVVANLLHGYHVQITARSEQHISPESIVQKVADASGAKYSAGTTPPPSSAPTEPPVPSKPVFSPTTRSAGTTFQPLGRGRVADNVDEDGWGADAPQVTRTQLEKVKPAYKPTKVNIHDLRSQPTATTSGTERSDGAPSDVVRGGYQPIGKVDIAAIRRQAQESGRTASDRPAPVRGAYEPVGKVDIAAIRAKAQRPSDEPQSSPSHLSPAATGGSAGSEERRSLAERSAAFSDSGRLTSLPKPRVTNKFAGANTFTGTKPPVPGGFEPKPAAAPIVGSASRTFADQGGKTPAQLWAERKARERGSPVETPPPSTAQPIQSQTSGGDGLQSSYTGKTWAPVQTTRTGASAAESIGRQQSGSQAEEPEPPIGGVSSIRDRFAGAAPMGAAAPVSSYERAAPSPPPLDTSSKPNASRGVPIPGLPPQPAEPEEREDERYEVPAPPQQPRSPTPEPAEYAQSSSPIRVAMPVGRGSADETVADAHAEQVSPPATLPIRSIEQNLPQEEELEEPARDPARAVAEAAVANQPPAAEPQTAGGFRALVQYDYEKAEGNEIDLREGEYVTNIDMVDEDWWMGVNAQGESGLFPRNYVELVEGDDTAPGHPAPAATIAHEPASEPEPPLRDQAVASGSGSGAPPRKPTATAMYDYEAAEDNEVGFPEGAKITNIEFPDEDWWHGEYKGKTGLFPANYVELDE